jgi:hypothetical protein
MTFDYLLPAAIAVLGSIWVGASVNAIRRKLAAERLFIAVLSSAETARPLREIWEDILSDGVATIPELKLLVAALERASEALPPEVRNLALEGLRQPSLGARARYAAKLVNRAGIASGPLPIPVA